MSSSPESPPAPPRPAGPAEPSGSAVASSRPAGLVEPAGTTGPADRPGPGRGSGRVPRAPWWLALLLCLGLAGLRGLPALLPYAGQAALDSLRYSVVVCDAQGGELQVLPLADGLRRQFVPLEDLPADLVAVVLQAEDRRFWVHPGVDLPGLLRAVWQNQTSGGTVSGASTLSMQLARLLNPRPRRDWQAKLAEMAEALQLESRLSKRAILELYLNLVPFGRNIEGFPAAARVFFGKEAAALDRAECQILAVIPRNPGSYDPAINPAANLAAARRLDPPGSGPAPAAGSAASPGAALDAALSRLQDPRRQGIWPFRAPQFVAWLQTRPEFAAWDSRRPLVTTLEPRLQAWLEDLLFRTVKEAERKRISNAAALFLRPGTMGVAAWVGSIDFDDQAASGQIDGVRMFRQPGSTLKPFLYALALGKGFTAATILPDIPQDFGGAEVYTPANFNDQFNGPVRLRQALASSLNVPAVYTLQRLGVVPFTDFLLQAGFGSLASQRGRLGLGLSLGNAEVSLLELVRAYGVFLHDGNLRDLTVLAPAGPAATDSGSIAGGLAGTATGLSAAIPRLPARQAAGFPLQSLAREGQPPAGQAAESLMSPAVAGLVRDILTRHPDRTLAFGRNSNTRMKFQGAMKTGTSNQFNNIWAVGFTPDLMGGVWMGNFSGSTVVGTADSGYPARIVNQTLEAFSAHPAFPPVPGLVRLRICSLSGKRAGPACPHAMEELFLPGTQPGLCDWHRQGPGGVQTLYPQEYRSWMDRYRYRGPGSFHSGGVSITRPQDKAVYFLDPRLSAQTQELAVEALGNGPAELWLDGVLVEELDFPVKTWLPLQRGRHVLEIRGTGPQGQKMSGTVHYDVR